LACRLESYLLQILRVVAEPFPSEVLQLLLTSLAAATFQHGILTQLACKESTVTLLRSLQYGSSLVLGHSSLIRIRLAGECLSSCTRVTSSFLARLLSRNTKCIEFGASTFKVEFTLTSITRCNSVLSLCENFRCHYQWPTCRLTVLTTSLAQLCTLKLLLSRDPTFWSPNK